MKIIIAGTEREGKTTIARLLVNALGDAGIIVEKVTDPDYASLPDLDDNQPKIIEFLKHNLKVEVETLRIQKMELHHLNVKETLVIVFMKGVNLC